MKGMLEKASLRRGNGAAARVTIWVKRVLAEA